MAVVRDRRHLNLRLPLPDSSDRCPRFPLPFPHRPPPPPPRLLPPPSPLPT
ncbi:UNVERIFIED_CONTAM: hypothetical protein Sradi_0124500 [Sesamum radiatum]|uniref:Uncharacterized protein n=1 Tax=Sesamum radiatum TaxID=300843 RepID=A0AAW2WM75_SESRA